MQENYAKDFTFYVQSLELEVYDPELIKLLFATYRHAIKMTMGANYEFLNIDRVLDGAWTLVVSQMETEISDPVNWSV